MCCCGVCLVDRDCCCVRRGFWCCSFGGLEGVGMVGLESDSVVVLEF